MNPDIQRIEAKVDELITMVRSLGTKMLADHERTNRIERHLGVAVQWIKWLRDQARGDKGDSMRPPMQTLTDVNAIEVSGFGMTAKARGLAPVRIIAVVLVLAAVGIGAYTIGHGAANAAQESHK